jgi:hypothetical protein
MPICGIYKIDNPIGQIYIGQSIDCFKRKNQYEKIACKKQNLIYISTI